MASMSPDPDATRDFVYGPLQADEIRILHLGPGNKGDALTGELHVSKFDDNAIEYDALSYMWGDPAPADRIYLSGKALPIASNLTTALRHMRYIDKPLVIWIDAICIDQKNYGERAKQVPHMRLLYKRASTVRIWINEPDVDSKCDAVVALQNFPKTLITPEEQVESMGDDPTFWDPLVPIFTNTYWTRAWVQQEVLNATQLSLHCMDIVVNGVSLAQFQAARAERWSRAFGSISMFEETWNDHLWPFARIQSPAAQDIFRYRTSQQRPNLCHILCFKDLYVSQPQDTLYAAMHLARDYEDGSIEVDYAKTIVEVMLDAAAYHVRCHRDLRFLYLSYLRGRDNGDDNRDEFLPKPTWLPQRWLGDDDISTLLMRDVQRTSTPPCCTVSTTNRRLRVRGMRFDHMQSCRKGLEHNETPRQFWNSLIGSYLLDSAGTGMENLPYEAFRVLFGTADYEMSQFAERIESLDATNNSTNQKYFWGVDKDNATRMLVLMKRAAMLGLVRLSQLSKEPLYADEVLFAPSSQRLNPLFVDELEPIAQVAIRQLFYVHFFTSVTMTRLKRLGRIPKCDFKSGDEIWIVLGIDDPLVLRPQTNGNYRHVCAAQIPSIQEHEDILNLSSDIQPGEKIGEWVVEDIEIE